MIFVDTSAWLALADSHDRDHSAAQAFAQRLSRGEFGKQVTTNYILTETLTIVRRRLGHTVALNLSENLAKSEVVRTFWIEPVHHREAIRLMADHRDKEWSVTDCSSFVVMHALQIQDAFTFDRDFARAGFTAVP
ncbi:MAG: type II toxin-antitoxin system VapC family toxin [Euryarchaeota archaeon]|nr:type II toxin-antitoxin system VapC family toxin [Euryarchaeota archaeon]MDE1835246.1 type II toxin-antitoxin system VapC family toxin [Euryarchaeota archaeon]MDE1881092.1 type II toxin-antitoxin system VapC family toxin [Euryarchaeota archaeon]MDE2043542.1 type II toxin-antitoxin system VapC family toxin [Thermoplasmata archaeon]